MYISYIYYICLHKLLFVFAFTCQMVSNFEIRVIQARLFSKDSSGRANRGNEHHSGENVRRLKCSDMDFLDFNSAFFKEGKSQCLSLKWKILFIGAPEIRHQC